MKRHLLEHILDVEWQMFTEVNALHPASCQSMPDKFRAIRGSQFETWQDDMLACYLVHLAASREQGRNLLAEKYARMDNLIPPLTQSPWLDEIVEVNEAWQREIQERYPALYDRCCRTMEPTGDGSNFSVYLRCELETYGDETLALYHLQVTAALREKRNLSLEGLRSLVAKSGYPSLESAEVALGGDAGAPAAEAVAECGARADAERFSGRHAAPAMQSQPEPGAP